MPKALSFVMLVVALVPVLASGQTPKTHVIDAYPVGKPGGREVKYTLVKTVGYFTSKTFPSVVLGTSRGLYLYTSSSGTLSGPWVRTTIDPDGKFYESSAASQKAGDTYPGIVISRSRQLVWYSNPMNKGGDATQRWPMEVINPRAGCHDLKLGDMDRDGLPDIVCSATANDSTLSFIAFQTAASRWQI